VTERFGDRAHRRGERQRGHERDHASELPTIHPDRRASRLPTPK
jgi:hypothetical protein